MTQRAKEQDMVGLEYQVMDIFDLKFNDFSFDCVLDKATLDAVFPEDTPKIRENVAKMFQDIFRVLKSNGYYIIISLL